jgi:hypothetical protein
MVRLKNRLPALACALSTMERRQYLSETGRLPLRFKLAPWPLSSICPRRELCRCVQADTHRARLESDGLHVLDVFDKSAACSAELGILEHLKTRQEKCKAPRSIFRYKGHLRGR